MREWKDELTEAGMHGECLHQRLETQLKPAKSPKIVITDTAKHFIMFDEPAWFFAPGR